MKRTPLAKRGKSPAAKAKAKCWAAFSRYIRTRDCLATTGTLDEGECVSCGKRHPFGKVHAGHFIPGRRNSILFDERGCHLQCYACNIHLHGNSVLYFKRMQKMHGDSVIDDLLRLNGVSVKFSVEDLDRMTADYEARTKALEEGV